MKLIENLLLEEEEQTGCRDVRREVNRLEDVLRRDSTNILSFGDYTHSVYLDNVQIH